MADIVPKPRLLATKKMASRSVVRFANRNSYIINVNTLPHPGRQATAKCSTGAPAGRHGWSAAEPVEQKIKEHPPKKGRRNVVF